MRLGKIVTDYGTLRLPGRLWPALYRRLCVLSRNLTEDFGERESRRLLSYCLNVSEFQWRNKSYTVRSSFIWCSAARLNLLYLRNK